MDAAPHPIDRLPIVRRAVGKKVPLVVDGGVTSGLDVARAIACGADFVLLGRAFMYAVVALGRRGGEHAAAVLKEELVDVMGAAWREKPGRARRGGSGGAPRRARAPDRGRIIHARFWMCATRGNRSGRACPLHGFFWRRARRRPSAWTIPAGFRHRPWRSGRPRPA